MVRRSPWISPFAVITGWTLWFTIIPCSADVGPEFRCNVHSGVHPLQEARLMSEQCAVSANEDEPASSWQSPALAT